MNAMKRRFAIAIFGAITIVAAACAVPPAAPPPAAEATRPADPVGKIEGQAEQVAAAAVMTAMPPKPGGSAARAIELAKKYAGVTLNVTWEAGLQSQDPLLFSAPEFERLTGVKINVIETPFTELFSKAVADHQAGGGAYDVLNFAPTWLADLADGGVLEPLDAYIEQHMDKNDLSDLHPTYAKYQQWKGKTYGLWDDGDVFVMYYRRDWFEDAKNKGDFKAKYNRELAPPKTWQEWDEVCSFFTERGKANNEYGCAIQRTAGNTYLWFYEQFRSNGGRFFDADMKAAINSDIGVKTLTDMVNANKHMPPGIEKWGFVEVLQAWMDGKLGMIITWPPIGRWSEGYGLESKQLEWVPKTNVAGKVGYAVSPGGHSELAVGFMLGVSSNSKNKEAAYAFIQWLTSPEVSGQRVKIPFALRDPYRMSHFNDPEYAKLWPNASEYLKVLQEGAATGLADLGIPGAREYEEALDRAITAAYAGTDPKAALDKAAEEWNAITERIGVESQKAAYADWQKRLGANAYP
ncbi:MAG: ABC transporter substrate-binding protein [Candidatus Roseilinea sp.]|nr:MAG: ABC transporter substrate-binding protein [Candidatus Roseilinea sp.]